MLVRLALMLIALLAALGCSGHPLHPKLAEAVREAQCEAKALAPFVEPVYDAASLIRDVYAGRADLQRVLRALGWVDAEELRQLADALRACQEPHSEVIPDGEQARVVAPPPAYGNKIL